MRRGFRVRFPDAAVRRDASFSEWCRCGMYEPKVKSMIIALIEKFVAHEES
jgi:hypothetical protein